MTISITLPSDTITFKAADIDDYLDAFSTKPGGIYAIYDNNDECLYVGKSIDLRSRLRNHLRSSPFASEIDYITVYFSNNEAERDIYETFAINFFRAKYNRDKVSGRKVLRKDVEQLEESLQELEELKIRRDDLIYEIGALDTTYGKPRKVRYINNFTGEVSHNYCGYIASLELFRENDERDYTEDKEALMRDLRQLDEEIAVINDKIRLLQTKVRA
ncbi:GIY-YIG nuclease family protein [Heyndrickxia sporothermodurans]|uniref:GIY-YIG nuclease family protein n=1 Tax=Heyndrickxia sporothermodurans TaxID=46224 RepID=UPI002E23FEFD|nr:GIY-YIG nuclease family protein [Heyndrickxia sporothermodurans]MED3697951.1 GIY-YIG nuclease family protein [Heyndrickxia sporothermodurans]